MVLGGFHHAKDDRCRVAVALHDGQAVAGPPEKASGKMVLDEVADGLRKYRKETNPDKRIHRLEQLARTHDPRVAIVLGDLLGCADAGTRFDAAYIIWRHYNPVELRGPSSIVIIVARGWWEENEADLRRRANQLPQ